MSGPTNSSAMSPPRAEFDELGVEEAQAGVVAQGGVGGDVVDQAGFAAAGFAADEQVVVDDVEVDGLPNSSMPMKIGSNIDSDGPTGTRSVSAGGGAWGDMVLSFEGIVVWGDGAVQVAGRAAALGANGFSRCRRVAGTESVGFRASLTGSSAAHRSTWLEVAVDEQVEVDAAAFGAASAHP